MTLQPPSTDQTVVTTFRKYNAIFRRNYRTLLDLEKIFKIFKKYFASKIIIYYLSVVGDNPNKNLRGNSKQNWLSTYHFISYNINKYLS